MRVLAALLLATLAAAPAMAQTLAVPIQGSYEDVYVIMGRALDSRGEPVRGGIAIIELEQEGIIAEPLRAGVNCKGDFLASFNLQDVDPRGSVKVTVLGPEGRDNGTASGSLDPFYRRTDVVVTLPGEWRQQCVRERDVWDVSASLSVRLLNRTAPFMVGDQTYHAKPYNGVVRLRYETPDGNTVCPPHPQDPTPGACESFLADERGDIRYTFTLDVPFEAGGRIEMLLHEGGSIGVQVDPTTRMAFGHYEITGEGPPAELYETPAAPIGLALAIVVLAAMAFSPRRR